MERQISLGISSFVDLARNHANFSHNHKIKLNANGNLYTAHAKWNILTCCG